MQAQPNPWIYNHSLLASGGKCAGCWPKEVREWTPYESGLMPQNEPCHNPQTHSNKPKTAALTIEEHVLCTLEFWREYPTHFHHGLWIGEFTKAQRNVERMEDALIKSGGFAPPGKRKLLEANLNFEVIVVDVTARR
jgi:hypothetical protein